MTFTLRDKTVVHAPLERCFLLSTSVAIVEKELGMRPVAGKITGLVVGGDTVTWKGWQLGIPQYHRSLISRFEPFHMFQDTMIAGRFAVFQHDHAFEEGSRGVVTLTDELRFSMPFGFLGSLIGRLILVPHISDLMKRRFALLKRIAETDEWMEYLPRDEEHLIP